MADDDANKRTCYVCYEEVDEDVARKEGHLWTKPCICKGATQYVHQACIQRWIQEKQGGSMMTRVKCPQCQTPFKIVSSSPGLLLLIMDMADNVLDATSNFTGLVFAAGSVWFSAMLYGGGALCSMMGFEEGKAFMLKQPPMFLMLGLPMIPVALVVPRFLSVSYDVVEINEAGEVVEGEGEGEGEEPRLVQPGREQEAQRQQQQQLDVPITRAIMGGLTLPIFSSICGRAFGNRLGSNMMRSVVGGVLFWLVKRSLRWYYVRSRANNISNRVVMDYTADGGIIP
eukprot:Colp12_sorted_trinity150504_noHs@6012